MNQSLNGFEALEERVLLAGNVTVAFNAAGDLVITGDAAANDIEIVDNDADGSYTIVSGANATNVTFSAAVIAADDANAGVVGTGVMAGDNLIVNLGKGNDYLGVFGSGVAGDLAAGANVAIDMGAGNDHIDTMNRRRG